MSEQTHDDPPWLTGPPPGYEPPPVTDLIDPAVRDETATKGAALVREVLAEVGLRKVGEKWTRTTPANEENER